MPVSVSTSSSVCVCVCVCVCINALTALSLSLSNPSPPPLLLHPAMQKWEDCVDVRGCGLMWGVELSTTIAFKVFTALKDNNFLVGLGGRDKNVLRVMR